MVGDDYQSASQLLDPKIGGKWYLNVLAKSNCSGFTDSFGIRVYDASLNLSIYNITVAIWKMEPTIYEKVHAYN